MLTELLQGIDAGGFLLIQGTVSKIALLSCSNLPRSGVILIKQSQTGQKSRQYNFVLADSASYSGRRLLLTLIKSALNRYFSNILE